MGRTSARKLTGDPGVGGGELATDDGLVGLRRIELAADLVPLVEEVADKPLGALIWGMEVRREVGVIPVKVKNRLKI